MAAYRIPFDVVVEILVCLPVKTILPFKSVCKDWCNLINSPLFIQLHLNKSLLFNFGHNRTLFYANDDSLCVVDDIYRPSKLIKLYWPKDIIRNCEYLYTVGSCNGLVCLRVTSSKYIDTDVLCFLICNPSTRTFKFKPNFRFTNLTRWEINRLTYGFGYDGRHDDYKIVTCNYLEDRVQDDVYIYSFKADSWKCTSHTLAESSIKICCPKLNKSVVCANNMLHYLVYSLMDDYNTDTNYRIARFDLSSETWRDDLSFPPVEEVWAWSIRRLFIPRSWGKAWSP
ncbi:F-box/kelch-repeat protein At3g23880-like [Silene latifolia]|uniref:F-box/kelch-repeat protein At3g23880-like n=1 Tax=Silene latifolia TaxID=37657 RepID=UPI003D7763ED